ncbi:MAG TPA: DUF5134 domain-containing protein [Mycobacteriales bacterium]|nr:DUF5134 domain-containing protein [Mycobacteriales bacterium]
MIPSWISDPLAAVMIAVAAYCAGRILVARARHRRTDYAADAVHAAMGVAMAGMLTARLTTTTPWIIVFVVATGWFGVRAVEGRMGMRPAPLRSGAHARHIATAGAMVYMLAAPAPASASPTHTSASMSMTSSAASGVRLPTIGLALIAFLVISTIVLVDRLSSQTKPDDPDLLAPHTVMCCQIAMNITMGYLLLTML